MKSIKTTVTVTEKIKKEISRCVICQKEIKYKDDYFKVELYIKGKFIGKDYAHKVCWDNRNNVNVELNKLLSGVMGFAKDKGMIKEEEVVTL